MDDLLKPSSNRALILVNTPHVHETVQKKRNRAQLTETYKYLNNYYNPPPERFLKKGNGRKRGHSQKIFQNVSGRLGQKNDFFQVKIVVNGNDLPAYVMEVATIGSFKRKLLKCRQ